MGGRGTLSITQAKESVVVTIVRKNGDIEEIKKTVTKQEKEEILFNAKRRKAERGMKVVSNNGQIFSLAVARSMNPTYRKQLGIILPEEREEIQKQRMVGNG